MVTTVSSSPHTAVDPPLLSTRCRSSTEEAAVAHSEFQGRREQQSPYVKVKPLAQRQAYEEDQRTEGRGRVGEKREWL